ncbi:MAG TPA: hypothetical protein VFX24_15475, partial [Ktedonobacterales bacterium]|nr:hypothetical protein [Ktedonobacterales bacterium]
TSAQTVRIEPPLVIEYDEIDALLDRLEDTLQAMSAAPVTGDVLQFPAVASAAPAPVATAASNGHSKAHGRTRPASKSGARHATRTAERTLSETAAR